MPYILTATVTTRVGNQDCLTTWPMVALNNDQPSLVNIVEDGLDWFETTFVPLLAAIQSDEATNTDITCGVVTQPVASRSRPISIVGTQVADDATTLPPHIPIYFRQTVGATFLVAGGLPYSGDRPIRRGGVFMPGLTESWVSEGGGTVAAGLLTATDALFDAYVTGFTGTLTGQPYAGCVWSYPRPELPPSPAYPSGRAERPYVYARVDGWAMGNVTRLRSRLS